MWTRLESGKSKGPSARSGARMAFNKDHIVLFGGFISTNSDTIYLSDLWLFSLDTYTWSKVATPTSQQPPARSGFSLLPCEQGIVLYGGYSIEKRNKEEKGIFHTDTWVLRMDIDAQKPRWERRKKVKNGPSPRAGCSMVLHKGRGVLFGGTYDVYPDEDTIESEFLNDAHIYHISANKWYPMRLKARKQPTSKLIKPQSDRAADLMENLASINGDRDTVMPDQEIPSIPDEDNEEEKKTKIVLSTMMPQPRFNASLAILDDTLFMYGGTYEKGDREYILDSLYSIDLGRLDGVRTIYDKTDESLWVESDDEDEDSEWESDEESDENEKLDMDAFKTAINEPNTDKEMQTEESPAEMNLQDSIYPPPDPFETLKHYYERCSPKFIEVQLQQSTASRGKELRRDVFGVVEEHFWSMREEVRGLEEQLEESGVGEVIVKSGGRTTRAAR